MAILPDGVTWSVIQTALAVLVYALIVNGFYQVISKRRMFANKADVKAEEDIAAVMEEAKHSAEEVKELAKADIADPDAKAAVVDAAKDTREAVKVAESEIRRQVARGPIWIRELRALVLFPLVGFLFFILLSANLVFIGATRPPLEIFSLSMAILLAVRIAAYISEATSHDLAKMLPLALLGFYLVQGDFAGIQHGNEALLELRNQWRVVLQFLLLSTGVEVVLRVIFLIARRAQWNKWMKEKATRFK